eukprot:351571-Chlamydomonas_euryale.AAC.2
MAPRVGRAMDRTCAPPARGKEVGGEARSISTVLAWQVSAVRMCPSQQRRRPHRPGAAINGKRPRHAQSNQRRDGIRLTRGGVGTAQAAAVQGRAGRAIGPQRYKRNAWQGNGIHVLSAMSTADSVAAFAPFRQSTAEDRR